MNLTATQVQTQTKEWQDLSVELLNDIFTPLDFRQRIRLLYKYFKEEEVLLTSSFGANSVFLIYWMQDLRPSQNLHFIDTTFHFPETLAYKEALTRRFNLKVVEVSPNPKAIGLVRMEELWKSFPDICCNISKVAPLEQVKRKHKVWVSGLMAYQTPYRSQLRVFERKGGILKFHPLIDVEERDVDYYFSLYNLPQHPLKMKGYCSIGCRHCTSQGEGRNGRWKGQGKTECGLHPG